MVKDKWGLGEKLLREICADIDKSSEVLAVPPLFLQESGHSGGIPVDSGGMKFSRGPC